MGFGTGRRNHYLSPEAYNATRPQQGSLIGIFDKDGNEVRLSRKDNGDLTEIKSPNGKWIRLRYSDGRMIEAKDSSGNSVGYGFDSANRLETVRYSDGHVTKYICDPLNRITGIEDSSDGFVFECKYDSQGQISEATVNDHLTYRFSPAVIDRLSKTMAVGVIDPHGKEYRIVVSAAEGISYTIEKPKSESTRSPIAR
jgi:YD repeat-containing protein